MHTVTLYLRDNFNIILYLILGVFWIVMITRFWDRPAALIFCAHVRNSHTLMTINFLVREPAVVTRLLSCFIKTTCSVNCLLG